MKKYIFYRKQDMQAENFPDQIIINAKNNITALAKVKKILIAEDKCLDAHGAFMQSIFVDFYEVIIQSRESELTYKNLAKIYSRFD